MDHPEPDPHHPTDGDTQGMGYERRDVNIRAVAAFGAGLTVAVIAVEFILMWAYRPMMDRRGPAEPPKPVESLVRQMKELREGDEATLASYGWVDRKAGVVRLPIDRAIDLVARRGVPKGKGPKTEAEINSDRGAPATPAPPDEKAKP